MLALGWIVAQYAKRVHAAGSLYDYVSRWASVRAWAASAGWVYYGGTLAAHDSAIARARRRFLRDNVLPAFEVDAALPIWAWSLI